MSKKRQFGEYTPVKKNHRLHTAELAAHDFFNRRDAWNLKGEPALMRLDDRPGLNELNLHTLDVHLLGPYAMPVALEKAHQVGSAAQVWALMERGAPT